MANKTSKYIILEDIYYTALDISETVKRFRPNYRLIGMADETAEALSMIRSAQPDMLIADTSASDGDSISILKESSVNIPVIFISEYASLAEKARSLNMVDFILKPVTPPDIERALDRFDSIKKQSLK